MLPQQRERLRNLHKNLQRGADHRRPRDRDRKPVLRAARAVVKQRRDHRDVPRDRRGVGDQEFVMTVQDAEEPRRHHQQSRAGKEDAHDLNRQVALVALEARRDHVDQVRRDQHAERDQHRYAQRQNRADTPREHVGGFVVALAEQFSINRDERRGEDAFAEQVLQDVGDAEASLESVGGGRVTEKVREDAVANEPGDPAEQYAECDRTGAARTGAANRRGLGARGCALLCAILTIGCKVGQVSSGQGSIATSSGR